MANPHSPLPRLLAALVLPHCALLARASSASGSLTLTSWSTAAFDPPSSLVQNASLFPLPSSSFNLTSFALPWTSWRFEGEIASPITDLLGFSIVSDGGVRLWLDDRLVVDGGSSSSRSSPATTDSFLNIPVVGGTAVPFRLEYARWGDGGSGGGGGGGGVAGSLLQLSWSGNFTSPSLVPASSFTPAVSSWQQQRQILRTRTTNPPVRWGTYFNPSMTAHAILPRGVGVYATLADATTGEVLGDIHAFPQFSPAATRPSLHSVNGSDYTEVSVARWERKTTAGVAKGTGEGERGFPPRGASGASASALNIRDCNVTFQSTVVNEGMDLFLLATPNGTDCGSLLLLVVPFTMPERPGFFVPLAGSSHSSSSTPTLGPFTLFAPGFDADNVTVLPVAPSNVHPVPFSPAGNAPLPHSAPVYLALPLATPVGVATTSPSTSTSSPPSLATVQAAIAAAAAVQRSISPSKFGANSTNAEAWDIISSVIAWNTIYTPLEGLLTPVTRGWDGGSGYVLFDWDNLFLAYMASIDETFLDIAYSNLLQIILARTVEGFVPNYASGPHISFDRTEPQIGALVALKIFNKWKAFAGQKQDPTWVVEGVFPALLSWNDWLWARRRGEGVFAAGSPDGQADLLVLGSDPNIPCSACIGNNTFAGARYESGLDNSAQYEFLNGSNVGFDPANSHHMFLYDVGFTSLFLSDTQALIALAGVVGREDAVPALQARFDAVQAAMQAHLWDESAGMFTNALYDGSFHPRYSPTLFFPLISGSATDAQADAMMATLTSPTGFCVNTSYAPMPGSSVLTDFWDGSHDNANCATGECVRDQLLNRDSFVRAEAAVVGAGASESVSSKVAAAVARASSSGGGGGGGGDGASDSLVPLVQWYSAAYGDNALTTNASVPPDPTYTAVRLEGYCFSSSSPLASLWPTTTLSLWWNAKRKDYQVCGSPGCLSDVNVLGYEHVADLCTAWNATGPVNLPCTLGTHSIQRGDESFNDNSYWRGRSWGPHTMLVWWGLQQYDSVPSVRAARLQLVEQGRSVFVNNWRLFGQVCENVNGITGVSQDVPNADPFYHWGALFGFVGMLEDGLY